MLSPGSTLAHYSLIERIGAGGMGEVWKARDQHLDRDVAVKLLLHAAFADPAARERFKREAHVLSRLSHPGVATIYDFATQDGVDFLVMEYVPGGTLQGRLLEGPFGFEDLVRLAGEVGDALEDAHSRGYLHRDLKPGNIALTDSGKPKLLDFGLAGLLLPSAAAATLTQAGSVLGTLPYMAPEQLDGKAGDSRTDVYSFGVILFEMATGQLPFQEQATQALMFQIFSSPPPSVCAVRPDLPPELDRLISSCLSKDPALRPASAGQVSSAIRELRPGSRTQVLPVVAPAAIRSLVVLPLENRSNDPAQEYFADGMTEALIFELSRIKALRVISRTSAMKYKGVRKGVPEIARELNVDAVLEGSALLLGNRVRISVQLIAARSDETLWADRYDRDLTDILGLQSDVAETVAREIAIQVTPQEAVQLAKRQAVNAQAHVEYLQGRHAATGGSPQAVDLALRHYARALELDPAHAPTWAGLAYCHMVRASRGMAPPAEAMAEAMACARRALELDESLSEAHGTMGAILGHMRDLAGASASLCRALELNPGLDDAYTWLGRVHYCSERHPEAQQAMLTALSLNPLSMLVHTAVGDAYYYAREYERSLVYYRKAIELDPRFDGAHTDLARSLESLGMFDESRAHYEEGRRLSGGVAGPSFGLAHLAASSGDAGEARRILAELEAARSSRVVSAWGLAALHACLGEVDLAFQWLDEAVAEWASGLIFLRVHPRMDAIRSDVRYPELLARVGLDRV